MVELNVVVADGYDREVFARVVDANPGLKAVSERLGRLLPHPNALLLDLFCLLFKLTSVVRKTKELAPSVIIHQHLVRMLVDSNELGHLQRHAALDEVRAAAATRMLAEQIVDILKQAFQEHPRELLKATEAAHDETTLERLRREMEQDEREGQVGAEDGEDTGREEKKEIEALQARLGRHRRHQTKAARRLDDNDQAIDDTLQRLPKELDEVEALGHSLTGGGDGLVGSQQRIELGQQMLRSAKLRRLARLLGAFRELAVEARRRRVVQAPQETHEIQLGAELERLLPSELFGLRRRVAGESGHMLHLEFARRFSEKQLLQYDLRGAASRGPMVVCLDGSGSMQGAKELWGKAVALTLMEIARRERRGCLAIIFSSGTPLFELELLAKSRGSRHHAVHTENVVRFAEHFPGGGTDFEQPLERALQAVTGGRQRKGDIVFITDGYSQVSEALVDRIAGLKKRHRFKIRSVLIDVGDHDAQTVARFSDDVQHVKDLTTDALTETFAAM